MQVRGKKITLKVGYNLKTFQSGKDVYNKLSFIFRFELLYEIIKSFFKETNKNP